MDSYIYDVLEGIEFNRQRLAKAYKEGNTIEVKNALDDLYSLYAQLNINELKKQIRVA